MSSVHDAYTRDANRVPITGLGLIASKTITYVELTTGAEGATTLFTVTGDVSVRVFAKCTTSLTGASATLEVGISGNTAALIAQTTGTTIDAGMVWNDASPGSVQALSGQMILIEGTDIIQTIASAPVTAGVLTFYCAWEPISSNGSIVAA